MYHSFLNHSSADGHLCCLNVLTIINSAGMNIGVHVSLSILVSLVCMPSSGIAGSWDPDTKLSMCLMGVLLGCRFAVFWGAERDLESPAGGQAPEPPCPSLLDKCLAPSGFPGASRERPEHHPHNECPGLVPDGFYQLAHLSPGAGLFPSASSPQIP